MIQRTYPEDDNDSDYYYIETTETVSVYYADDIITVTLDQEKFEIDWPGAHLEIGLNLTDKELEDLNEILKARFNDRVRLKK